MFPTRHSVERFKERVAPVTTAEAARRIRAYAATAKVCRQPRRWTPARPTAGLSFLNPPGLPGVCFLVRDGAVLTVFERSAARAWAQREAHPSSRRRNRTEPYRRPSPGSLRWEAACSTGGTGIPRLPGPLVLRGCSTRLLEGATFEEVRRVLVDRARDLDRETDLDGSFDEAKWERRRNDPTAHVNNAVDVLKEAMRLGWVEQHVLPSTPHSAYLHSADVYHMRPAGRAWGELVLDDRRAAYDSLAGALIDAHPQMGGFLKAVGATPDSTASAFTIPLLRWDPMRHTSEHSYLDDLVAVVTAAAGAGSLGWTAKAADIDAAIRGYVERIRPGVPLGARPSPARSS